MPFIDRRYIRHFDWISFGITALLCIVSLLFVFSATYRPEIPYSLFFKKQLIGMVSGFCIYLLFCIPHYKTVMRWGYFGYIATLGLLVFTLLKGHVGMGAQRWINLGFIKLQPSELAKLLFPAFATYFFYTQKDSLDFSFKEFLPILGILGLSFLLILKQPDLGTALILLFSALTLFWLAGLNKKFFMYGALFVLCTAPLSWKVLKPYQKKRVLVFLGQGDSKKERYQIEQSKIAIGSGGMLGKGFLKGTQNKLRFLPEGRTDFIFSVICEEWGFLRALLVIILYVLLFCRMLWITTHIKNAFVQLLAIGLIIHIILSTIINIGMVIGLLPIVGIPLPLISYGLSSLWVTFASLGWFNGIAMRRFHIGK